MAFFMLGRLFGILNLCEPPNPNVVRTICAANCGVSSTLRGKLYKENKKYKLRRE